MAASNINRLMGSFLRFAGGRLKWVAGILHIRNEEDTADAGIKVASVEVNGGVTVKGPDIPDQSYDFKLPNDPGVAGQILTSGGGSDTYWSSGSGSGVTPRLYEVTMTANTLSYILPEVPLAGTPVTIVINGIEVDFTLSVTTITITTYTVGEIDGTEELRAYYYI